MDLGVRRSFETSENLNLKPNQGFTTKPSRHQNVHQTSPGNQKPLKGIEGEVAKKAGLEQCLNKVTIRVQETIFLFHLTTKDLLVMRIVLIVSKRRTLKSKA